MSKGLTEKQKRELFIDALVLCVSSIIIIAATLILTLLAVNDHRLNPEQQGRVLSMASGVILVFVVVLCFRLWRLIRLRFR